MVSKKPIYRCPRGPADGQSHDLTGQERDMPPGSIGIEWRVAPENGEVEVRRYKYTHAHCYFSSNKEDVWACEGATPAEKLRDYARRYGERSWLYNWICPACARELGVLW